MTGLPILSDSRLLRLRLAAQQLVPDSSPSPASVEKLLTAICGVQAQDLLAAQLSIHARQPGLSLAEIEQARLESHRLIRTWCMRGTLHLVSAQDARWLVPLFGSSWIDRDRRRMLELGWTEPLVERGLKLIQEALVRQGSLTREEIIQILKSAGLPSEGQAPIHLIGRAASECLLCQGPDRGKKPTYVSFEAWAGKPEPLPRQQALSELARRYLAAYAPAGPRDLASWSGLQLNEARQAWQSLEDRLVPIQTESGERMWILPEQQPRLDRSLLEEAPVVRLLPRFDTYLLGYACRDQMVPSIYAKRINAGGGLIAATLLVDGRILGTWKSQRHGTTLAVTIEPFESLPGTIMPVLEEQADGIGRFLGVKGATLIYP